MEITRITLLEQIGDDLQMLKYAMIDLKGNIPTSIVNMMMTHLATDECIAEARSLN